jgi:NAD-dependent DNA ligase
MFAPHFRFSCLTVSHSFTLSRSLSFPPSLFRGDGTEGEDVTANAKRFIATLPATVKPIDVRELNL